MDEDDGDQLNRESDRLQTLTLSLFDLYWFHSFVLVRLPPPPSPPTPPPSPPPTPPEVLPRRRSNHHRRSLSDDLLPSPALEIRPPGLQAVLSGEGSVAGDGIPRFGRMRIVGGSRRWPGHRGRREIRGSKSLSELEFEELKGFMDLGFTFSGAEADPRLMEIVPGLQRLKAATGDDDMEGAGDDSMAVARRPYLSEAWEVEEEEEEDIPVRRFEIPMEGGGADLKDRLKFWAQAVASTVR